MNWESLVLLRDPQATDSVEVQIILYIRDPCSTGTHTIRKIHCRFASRTIPEEIRKTWGNILKGPWTGSGSEWSKDIPFVYVQTQSRYRSSIANNPTFRWHCKCSNTASRHFAMHLSKINKPDRSAILDMISKRLLVVQKSCHKLLQQTHHWQLYAAN